MKIPLGKLILGASSASLSSGHLFPGSRAPAASAESLATKDISELAASRTRCLLLVQGFRHAVERGTTKKRSAISEEILKVIQQSGLQDMNQLCWEL